MGLRFRPEAARVTNNGLAFGAPIVSFPAATTIIVPAAALVGVQRAGLYSMMLSGNSATPATFQFQDTNNNNISAVYNIAANQFIQMLDKNNFDPWFQPATFGLGIQIVVSGATITGDIYWAAGA